MIIGDSSDPTTNAVYDVSKFSRNKKKNNINWLMILEDKSEGLFPAPVLTYTIFNFLKRT